MSGDRSEVVTAKPVTVEGLEKSLGAAHNKPDAEVAQQLSGLRLTERLSSTRLFFWKAKLPGAKSSQALVALADASAFLDPPAADLPATEVPDIAEQRRIFGLTLDYLAKTIPKLPNFFATRITNRYDDSAPNAERAVDADVSSSRPWRATGSYSATVFYREGKEVVDSEAVKARQLEEEEKSLVTKGVFGPILSTVIGDASRSGMTWSHWEQGVAGPVAVFRYAVPRAESHYEVAYLGLPGKDKSDAPHQYSSYHGEIVIDPATGAILRLTLETAVDPSLSIVRGDIMVEYGPVEIGGRSYICPVRSVSISEVRTVTVLRKVDLSVKRFSAYRPMLNDVVFKDYHIFSTEMRLLPADDSTPEEKSPLLAPHSSQP